MQSLADIQMGLCQESERHSRELDWCRRRHVAWCADTLLMHPVGDSKVPLLEQLDTISKVTAQTAASAGSINVALHSYRDSEREGCHDTLFLPPSCHSKAFQEFMCNRVKTTLGCTKDWCEILSNTKTILEAQPALHQDHICAFTKALQQIQETHNSSMAHKNLLRTMKKS
ncbi:hypothetical protein Pelo_15336 [Pelomyxa schiedti]|nr:hypothetical protein Pelo_15336 [Pelomyxa schiedti]